MAKSLVGIAIYKSSKETRKLSGRKYKERDSGAIEVSDKFETPVKEEIVKWLKSNTLVKMTEAMPGHYHSDSSYILQGSNNTLCAIYPEMINLKGGNVGLLPKDHEYQWEITIRYQPVTNELPVELTGALSELGFEKK